jgi:phage terminase small subunit
MKRGPKTKPTELKKLEGNPGKRRLSELEPDPEPKIPACPAFLKGAGRKEWKRITAELFTLGLVTPIDRGALAGYCIAYGQLEEAEQELARMKKSYREMRKVKKKNPDMKVSVSNGMTRETSNGNVIMEPMLSVRKQALEQMHKFLTEFGMTPASRSRIEVEKKPKRAKSPMEELLSSTKAMVN